MTLTQINKAGLDELALDHVFTIGASGTDHYTFQGEGLNGTVNDPTLYLTRGKTYRFENGSGGHPIRIQSTSGASGTAYNTGVTNNAGSGTVIVEVQHDAPDVLYYQCTSHANMNGVLYITGALADGGVTTAKLADDAVTTAKINQDAVTSNSIANDAVAQEHIATNAIVTNNIVDANITTGKIADGAVTQGKLANNSVTNNKIASDAIVNSHLSNNSVNTAEIYDEAVTLAKLEHGTSSNNGKFLRANNGADPSFETVTSTTINGNTNNNIVTATGTANTLQGESNLTFDGNTFGVNSGTTNTCAQFTSTDAGAGITFTDNATYSGIEQNGQSFKIQADAGGTHAGSEISFEVDGASRMKIYDSGNVAIPHDNKVFKIGAGDDLQIYHNGSNTVLANSTGHLLIGSERTKLGNPSFGHIYLDATLAGSVDLYHNNSKKLETTSYGTKVTGYQSASTYVGFHVKGTNSNHGFGTNHGSGITTYDVSYYSPIPMWSTKTIDHGSSYLSFPSYAGGNYIKFTAPVAGLYQLELIASVESHHGGDWCQMGWEVNTETANSSSDFMNNSRGVLSVNERAGDDTEMGCHFSTTIWLDTNDYAVLYQQSTQAVRWRGNQYYARGHLI